MDLIPDLNRILWRWGLDSCMFSFISFTFNSYFQVENYCPVDFLNPSSSDVLRFFFLAILINHSGFSKMFIMKSPWSSSVPASSVCRHGHSWRREDEAACSRPHSELLTIRNLDPPVLKAVLLPYLVHCPPFWSRPCSSWCSSGKNICFEVGRPRLKPWFCHLPTTCP